MTQEMQCDSYRCECGSLLIVDEVRGEKGCTKCGRVMPLEIQEQTPAATYDKDGNRVGYHVIAKVGTVMGKDKLDTLHLLTLKSYHFSDERLEGIISTLQRKAEKWLSLQDKKITEAVLSMIEKRVRAIYVALNENAQKDAAKLGIKCKPVYPTKALLDSIIRQIFKLVRISYSDRIKRRKILHNAENLTEFERKWLKNEEKEKRGRKKGENFTNYHLWEYYGRCCKCGNELQEGQSVADHVKKHHPDKTIQSGYNWFKRKPAGRRTDVVLECPKCGRHGSLYRRSDGYYVFEHNDSSQHYITKDMAEMVIENLRYKKTCSTSRTGQMTGV